MGGVVERGDALAGVVVAHLPDEEGESPGAVVAEGVDDLGHVERGVPDGDESHGVGLGVGHAASLGDRWRVWAR